MIHLTGVYLTDDVAKDGTRFPIETLNEIAFHGVSAVPSNIGHDLLRPIGWTVTNKLLITPGKSYLLGDTIIPETKEECDDFIKNNREYIIGRSLEDAKEHTDVFTAELEKVGVKPSRQFFYNNIAIYQEDGIAKKLYPKLFAKMDKDGLLYVNDILDGFDYKGQGVFADKYSGLAIMLHPYFRKSYFPLNNYNFSFLDEFFKLQGNPNVRLRVKIDPNNIGYSPSLKTALEYEYWYGPKYNDDISQIPNGTTVYKSNPEKEKVQKIFNQIEQTDFVFNHRDGDTIFEMEEVTDEESFAIGKDMYGCRYLHSIYKDDNGEFDHFDGAIRTYTLEKITERIDSPIDKMGHDTIYTKIFRLDGKIPLSEWKLLITLYLHGNPDVYKYFGVKNPNEKVLSAPKECEVIHLFSNITSNSGMALYASYWNKTSQTEDVVFDSFDEGKFNGESIKTIDSMSLDIAKSIAKHGVHIVIPNDLEILDVCDGIHNIPVISFRNADQGKLDAVIHGIVSLLDNLCEDQLFAFTLCWPMEERNIRISFVGCKSQIAGWLHYCKKIPVTRDDFKNWLNAQYECINKIPRDKATEEFIKSALFNGEFYIKRTPIQKYCKLNDIAYEDGDLKLDVDISNPEVKNLMSSGKTGIVKGDIIKKENIKSAADNKRYIDSDLIAGLRETKMILEKPEKMLFFFMKL